MKSIIYKRKINLGLTALLSLLLLNIACTDRIYLETEAAAERLVIYGYITTDTMQHSIRITRSTGYFATAKPAGISGALVTISSGDTLFHLKESATEAGLYLTDPDVYGVEGKTYQLLVSLDYDEDGVLEEYTATSFLPPAPQVDSIQVQAVDLFFGDYVEVLFYGTLPDIEENYFKFHVFRNQVALNDSLIDFSMIDDEYIENKILEGVSCFYLDQEEDKFLIEDGDLITLRVDGITKEYSEFLMNAQTEVYGSNPLFSGPPANVETNIRAVDPANKNLLVGFFSAFSGTSASTIYREE
ncbi:MAG: DUF4249 domain-containing protein [Tannerellaceae bacterium]|nr:DUF4249 domain-containing protein [Tannerellaceae bacterium]